MAAFKWFRTNKSKSYDHEYDVVETDIDRNMRLSQDRAKRTVKILLLGPGDSGKSTIVKQMKKIHHTLQEQDIQMLAPYIQDALVEYTKLLCFHCQELHEKDDEKTMVQPENESLRQEFLNMHHPYIYDESLADKISQLWADPAIKETLRLRSKFQIHDNVAYFFNRVHEIYAENYEPNFEDYVRIRTRSTGLATENINANLPDLGEYGFEFTDVGGQRSERKKWMKIVFDQIQAILYVVALSEYDLKCIEDNETNRLIEALNLFQEVVNNNFFEGKTVMIFFNKYDLFQKKIKTTPITVAFPDFPVDQDPNDEDSVVQYVAMQFLKCFNGKNIKLAGDESVRVHRTTALDTNNIQKIFSNITVDLVKTNLKDCGMI